MVPTYQKHCHVEHLLTWKLREPKFEKTLAQHLVRDPMFPVQNRSSEYRVVVAALVLESVPLDDAVDISWQQNTTTDIDMVFSFSFVLLHGTGNITFQQRGGVPQSLLLVLLLLGWKRVGLVVRGVGPCFPCVFNVPMFNVVIVHHHDHVPQKLSKVLPHTVY